MFESSSVLFLLFRLAVGIAFFVAGVMKLRIPGNFTHLLSTFPFVTPTARTGVVLILPAIEISIGGLLIAGVLVTGAAVAGTLLCLGFSAVVLVGVGQQHFDCGCFGTLLPGGTKRNVLARNLALTLAAAGAALGGPGTASLQAYAGLNASLAAVAAAVAAILFVNRLSATLVAAAASTETPVDAGRRSFLTRTATIAAGGAIALAVAGLQKVRLAEAACSYCGSCSSSYIWIGCTGACCAAFWVRDNKYCSGSCLSCSAWRVEEYCGYAQCC